VTLLDPERVRTLVRDALAEDVGEADRTSLATVPEGLRAQGFLLAKQDLVVCGLEVAREVFACLEPAVAWTGALGEGSRARPGAVLARLSGRARPLLTAERVALNFLQRMCGVATLTRSFVDAVAGTKARIRDTRKTTPLLRALEKHAVQVGGGLAHRSGLDTGVLVKDNHVRLAGSVLEATRRARATGLPVEVEVERADQIEDALQGGADMILLDNFTPEAVRKAVKQVGGRVPIEVSGGVRLDTVRLFAEAGPDFIAVGALTHSAPAADISLEFQAESAG
jgi:nicotinate-nucleotide pyrophosphorylase (carboxylating)